MSCSCGLREKIENEIKSLEGWCPDAEMTVDSVINGLKILLKEKKK